VLRALYKSDSLRAAALLGLGGLAFTLANLILARTLPSQEYGVVSLVLGIVSVSALAAPLGLDLVISRRGLLLDSQLRRAILAVSAAVAVATVVISAVFYHLAAPLLVCILVTTIASGLMQASAAHFQGQQRFGLATCIVQLSNWTLFVAALLTAAIGFETATGPCVLIALTTAAGGVGAWILARAHRGVERGPAPRALFGEAISLVSIQTCNATFLQLERLLLAPIAGVHALALFGVVAALVGSPFRMLQMAVLFTLVPNLRQAADAAARQRLLRREMLLVAGVIAAGSGAIWAIAPPLAHWFLAGRYDLSAALMCAAIVSGVLKLCSAFATGTVIALAEDKGLRTLSAVSWATIGLSVVAAIAAAPWGLVGVLYGISVGWLVRSLIATWMAISTGLLRAEVSRPQGPPPAAPLRVTR
jgi:O-antigen/teichoic acid export membrane protein